MKKFNIEIKWALALCSMSVILIVLEKLFRVNSGIFNQQIYTNVMAISSISIYILALLEKKRKYFSGQMSFKQGFKSGLVITIIIAILNPLTQLITFYFFTQDYFPNAIKNAVVSGKMIQVEANVYFNITQFLIQGFIRKSLFGIITSLIVAFFVKSKNKEL